MQRKNMGLAGLYCAVFEVLGAFLACRASSDLKTGWCVSLNTQSWARHRAQVPKDKGMFSLARGDLQASGYIW